MRAFLGVLVFLALLLVGVATYALLQFDGAGPLADARAVVVPHGSMGEVSAALARAGVVSSASALEAASVISRGGGGTVHAGELEFPAHASLRQVLVVLRTGKQVMHKVTVPEGLTAAQVALLLDRAPALDGETVIPGEGMFLPETYVFERGLRRSTLAERGRDAMQHAVDRAWQARKLDLPLASQAEMLILASIVERETGKAEERPHVAAVFLNRLRRGMKLQTDPTIIYAVSGGFGTLNHGLTRAELDRDDPYNTYRIPGLPPGPICMPGAASLKAVTQPLDSEDLFFVADGTGGHAFAKTQEEHQRNVLRWRELERAKP